MAIGIGIDTGGTYTDAVAFDFETREVVAKGKSRTTKEDLSRGIAGALDFLPREVLEQAAVVALSTTLATNACVEDKGGRAKLVLMGTTDKVLRRIDAEKEYGLRYDDVLCLDTHGSFDGSVVDEPDWDAVVSENRAWFADAQALSLCEANAARNGAVCERGGKEFLRERFDVPFVMGCELSSDLNMMARGATALLNARLLPVIDEFLHATRRALRERGVDAPVMIVRSDGSLMGERLAFERPVETILSGPAASVHGSRELAELDDCLVVDMGGTTTDISLVVGGAPVMTDGIRIGSWKTQAKGVFIETFGLGGDSAVRIENGALALSERRVEPISALAERWPEFVPKMEVLLDGFVRSPQGAWEVLYLVREPKEGADYTAAELEIVELLREGPCLLGDRERVDMYTLNSERLESEGIVMRAGLTPTDVMQVKGDFERYDTTAARLVMRYIAEALDGCGDGARDAERFADEVYELVEFKLYRSIVGILLRNRYPRAFGAGLPAGFDEVLGEEWRRARTGERAALFDMNFTTPGVLIGIGAPTHIFLPAVARALGAEYVIPEHAEVANAVGAIVADITATAHVRIEPINSAAGVLGYVVHGEERVRFESDDVDEAYDAAVAVARDAATRLAEAEALRRGAEGPLDFEVDVKRRTGRIADGQLLDLGTTVTAVVTWRR